MNIKKRIKHVSRTVPYGFKSSCKRSGVCNSLEEAMKRTDASLFSSGDCESVGVSGGVVSVILIKGELFIC